MPSTYVLNDGTFVPLTYTLAEIDAMFSAVPISRFGSVDSTPVPFTVSGAGVTATVTLGTIPLFLTGRKYLIDTMAVNVGKTTGSGGGTVYLYAKLSEGVIGILISTAPLDETLTQMYIGSVTVPATGNLVASNVSLEKVTRIDIYRLSPTRRGTAIPVSTGSPFVAGTYKW